MDNRCSICGCTYQTFAFKGGYVCEDCLQQVKENFRTHSKVRKG